MNNFYSTMLFILMFGNLAQSQAPCITNFNGFDPCSAEPLNVSQTCAGSSEQFLTNGCLGTPPSISSCGLNAGTEIVWGTFNVIAPGNYTVNWIASNNRNIRLAVYQFTNACAMTGPVEIGCANNGGNGANETLTLALAAGTYYVCGMSSGSLTSASTICVYSPSYPPAVTASDCIDAVNVCTNLTFSIDPNGEGLYTNEIAPLGTIGNPNYDGITTFNPWGTSNLGCLLINESNSTWMRINILTGGNLDFIFGGNNSQAGFYDWIMYPASATCASISSHNVAPVRCNWNAINSGGTGLANTLPPGGNPGNFEPSLPVLAGQVYILCFSNYSNVQTAVPLQFGGSAVVSCIPLPVELINFKGEELSETRQNKLSWQTLSERDNQGFMIERGDENGTFNKIGFVQGAGNSSQTIEYSFVDEQPEEALHNYYRLTQLDFDGENSYSDIISIRRSIEQLSLFPNPTSDALNISLTLDATFKFYDLNGRLLVMEMHQINERLYQFNCKQLEKGTYIATIHYTDGNVARKPFVVN